MRKIRLYLAILSASACVSGSPVLGQAGGRTADGVPPNPFASNYPSTPPRQRSIAVESDPRPVEPRRRKRSIDKPPRNTLRDR